MLAQQLEMGEKDMEYLESVLAEIAQAENESDLEQIRQELQQTGYLTQRRSRRRVKTPASKPFVYETEDGFRIYAGKNNVQNDLLTLKTAHKNDIWFHTQKIHGSHVILSCAGREPTEHAMTRAAQIAAYHSRASQSAAVPVDYTPVKYIKKPAGARPGMVIYHVYQTAFVTPQPAVIEGCASRHDRLYFPLLVCYNIRDGKVNGMNEKIHKENVDQLFAGILSLRSVEECYSFFEDLCTVNELFAMAQRFQVATMLSDGRIYSDIVKETGASTATISRVNKCLSYGSDGYRLVLARRKEEQDG